MSELFGPILYNNDVQQSSNNFMPYDLHIVGSINININNASKYNNISKLTTHPDQCSH